MTPDAETTKRIAASVTERESLAPTSERVRGLIRVDLDVVEGVASVARHGHHAMPIDEPIERGGTDTGASPLAHFLAGVGA
ncbi:MAG: hypothetical protein O2884_14785 [Chloroflexi bacterium]|nr:hypothetical protein [Chloroflexota bacterium]